MLADSTDAVQSCCCTGAAGRAAVHCAGVRRGTRGGPGLLYRCGTVMFLYCGCRWGSYWLCLGSLRHSRQCWQIPLTPCSCLRPPGWRHTSLRRQLVSYCGWHRPASSLLWWRASSVLPRHGCDANGPCMQTYSIRLNKPAMRLVSFESPLTPRESFLPLGTRRRCYLLKGAIQLERHASTD